MTLAPKGKGGCDSSIMPATGSRTLAQTAGGKRKGLVWDLVKDVESVIKKDGNKTSEKRWVCRFCEKPFQGGPNVIQAHHGVHGTGKKKAIQLCKHTPADVKARLQQEMSITLRSIAEKETSEVIQIVRQQEDHVARMENAGVELSMLVESGQLKLAFPRVPASPTVASAAPTSATSSGSSSTATTRNEPNLAADSEQTAKQSAPNPQSVPKVTMISAVSKLHSKAIADELDENLSAGWIAAGIPPTALENPILKKALELVARKARTTHVHTTVASFSHSHSCSQANTLAFIHMHEDISVCSGRAIRCKVVGRLQVTTRSLMTT